MQLLILGGTIFLGRHFVDLALAAGDTVTLFTRGKHNPDLFPGVERITGDRAGDLHLLEGRTWDAVLDTSGYLPAVVSASARSLAGRVGHYTFVSSISVYRDFRVNGIDEDYPCGELAKDAAETLTNDTYGPLKALCEQAVLRELPDRTLNIRPGLIVGPHDPSDRFTYWPERVARGGEVLAPDGPHRVTQVIDARDLAAWMLHAIRTGLTGTFNATSPGIGPLEPTSGYPLSFGALLESCRRVSGSNARFTWLPEPFLAEEKVGAWMELPLWVPIEPDSIGFDSVSVDRAMAAGLRFRPIAGTIRDTLSWAAAQPPDRVRRAGLDPEKEAAILQRWKERGEVPKEGEHSA
jgi:2'-hydroxyisoflavone reductase